MVELLVVVTLVVCFFLALLDYIPKRSNKYINIYELTAKPWFRLLLSLIVAILSLLLIGVHIEQLVLLSLASTFLSHGALAFFKKA